VVLRERDSEWSQLLPTRRQSEVHSLLSNQVSYNPVSLSANGCFAAWCDGAIRTPETFVIAKVHSHSAHHTSQSRSPPSLLTNQMSFLITCYCTPRTRLRHHAQPPFLLPHARRMRPPAPVPMPVPVPLALARLCTASSCEVVPGGMPAKGSALKDPGGAEGGGVGRGTAEGPSLHCGRREEPRTSLSTLMSAIRARDLRLRPSWG
jgi:hypothetical protein